MSGLKIVVIGGGSSYTPELIEGLLNRYHEMPVASLWLVDIEEGKEKRAARCRFRLLAVSRRLP